MYETSAASDLGTDGVVPPNPPFPESLSAALDGASDVPSEQAVQAVQAARMAAVGELAGGVVHEINNPLFAILGLVEFLLRDAEPGTKAHERLTLVHETGLEIKTIARALLDFARERPGESETFNLSSATAATVELFRRTSAARDVEIELRADPYVAVHGSAAQLKQLVLHLLANAREALPVGGSVAVEIAAAPGEVVLRVTDSGSGIPTFHLNRIFEPFFTTHPERGAGGLGLAAARTIAVAHGGTLTAESAPGSGARLTLRLPAAPASA
jgi:two-component system, NtrC family, sensor kinase